MTAKETRYIAPNRIIDIPDVYEQLKELGDVIDMNCRNWTLLALRRRNNGNAPSYGLFRESDDLIRQLYILETEQRPDGSPGWKSAEQYLGRQENGVYVWDRKPAKEVPMHPDLSKRITELVFKSGALRKSA